MRDKSLLAQKRFMLVSLMRRSNTRHGQTLLCTLSWCNAYRICDSTWQTFLDSVVSVARSFESPPIQRLLHRMRFVDGVRVKARCVAAFCALDEVVPLRNGLQRHMALMLSCSDRRATSGLIIAEGVGCWKTHSVDPWAAKQFPDRTPQETAMQTPGAMLGSSCSTWPGHCWVPLQSIPHFTWFYMILLLCWLRCRLVLRLSKPLKRRVCKCTADPFPGVCGNT